MEPEMTHEELVEKVARAIWDVCGFVHGSEDRMFEPLAYGEEGEYAPVQAECQRAARAALSVIYEAMREPADEMLEVHATPVLRIGQPTVQPVKDWRRGIYVAMLAASPLNPEGK